MTVNVRFTVPDHVHVVLVSVEDCTKENGWVQGTDHLFFAGETADVAIFDTRRIRGIQEFTRDEVAAWGPEPSDDQRLVTLNEAAHGHEE